MLAISKMYKDLITLPGDSEEGDDESEPQLFWYGALKRLMGVNEPSTTSSP